MSDEIPVGDVPETSESLPASTPAVMLGVKLATERELKGWTVEQVAGYLNLAPRQIYALEAENYAALPGMASVRGFVRAYAKLLKIDAAPLVAMIPSEQITPTQPLAPTRSVPPTSFSDNRLMSGRRTNSPKTILLAVLVGLVLVVVIVLGRKGDLGTWANSLLAAVKGVTHGTSSGAQAGASRESSAVGSSSASAMSEALPAIDAHGDASASAPSPTTSPTNAAGQTGNAASAHPNAVVAGANPASAAQAGAPTNQQLVLKFREDSWVGIRAGHTVLISKMVKAGATEEFEIKKPATLKLGNALGVDVTFRGNPLDFKADAKNHVVHLSLK